MRNLSVLALAIVFLSANVANAAPWSFNVERLMAAWAKDKCTVEQAAELVAAVSK